MKTIIEAFLIFFIPSVIYFVVKNDSLVLNDIFVISTKTGWGLITLFVLPFYLICKLLIHLNLLRAVIFISIINCIVIAYLIYRLSYNDFVNVHFEKDHYRMLVLTFIISSIISSLILKIISFYKIRNNHNSTKHLHNIK